VAGLACIDIFGWVPINQEQALGSCDILGTRFRALGELRNSDNPNSDPSQWESLILEPPLAGFVSNKKQHGRVRFEGPFRSSQFGSSEDLGS